MSAYPVNLTDEDDGTVVVTSPDSELNDLRSGSGRSVGACGGGIRGGDRVWLARTDGRSGAAAPGGRLRGEGDALPGDSRTRMWASPSWRVVRTGTFRGRSRVRSEPPLAAGPDRRSAPGRRPAVGRSWRRRHTFGFTCDCDERWCLTVTVAAAADLDAAGETPEGALPRRDRNPSLPAQTHRVFMDRLVRCRDSGRGAEDGWYQKAVERVVVMHRQFGCAIPLTTRWRSPKATSTTTAAASCSRPT